MEHHPKEPALPAEKWTEEDRRKMAGSPLGQKALQWLDLMANDVLREIADACLPETTVTVPTNLWGGQTQAVTKINPREQTVYQRGRYDLLNEIRTGVFGSDR